MRITCPNNINHVHFETTAHVQQLWVVDSKGDFVRVIQDLDVVRQPSPDGIFLCVDCGREAKVDKVL